MVIRKYANCFPITYAVYLADVYLQTDQISLFNMSPGGDIIQMHTLYYNGRRVVDNI